MFMSVTCAICQQKFSVPEGSFGQKHTCPNCQSPFVVGGQGSAPDIIGKKQQAAPAPGEAPPLNKTMLAEPDPPIRYNCPRCKKPLGSPASEAGAKKPCPGCGQRLQVPAPPASS